MKSYFEIEKLINKIYAHNNEELKKEIVKEVNNSFSDKEESKAALKIYTGIFLILEIFLFKNIGLNFDFAFTSFLNLTIISPFILFVTIGIFYAITEPIFSMNLFKAKKVLKKYKTINIEKIVEDKNFDNPEFVGFLKSFNIDTEKYKTISQNELEHIIKKTNSLPNFIKTKIKKKIVDLMIKGRELRVSDKEVIEKIIEETNKIKGKDEKMSDFIEKVYDDVNNNELDDGLFIDIKMITNEKSNANN